MGLLQKGEKEIAPLKKQEKRIEEEGEKIKIEENSIKNED